MGGKAFRGLWQAMQSAGIEPATPSVVGNRAYNSKLGNVNCHTITIRTNCGNSPCGAACVGRHLQVASHARM